MKRENLEFGKGSFLGSISHDPTFWELPLQEQARILGWANSCPVVDELTDPNNPNPGRGPESMSKRYAEVNFWFGFIGRETQRLNPKLYDELMTPIERLPNEPAGKYEPHSVPQWYTEKISPMGTLAGYALPRIFVEQLGKPGILTRNELNGRLTRGLNILEASIPDSQSPNELLARVAEGLAVADVEPITILRQTLSQGWLGEHNARRMLEDFKMQLQQHAPNLWQYYSSLSEEQKSKHKLA